MADRPPFKDRPGNPIAYNPTSVRPMQSATYP